MLLSIIIPAYNVEKYIEAALDSVFAQDMPVYEVIVVNDGSTDSTYDKAKRYERRPCLKLLSTDNMGLGPARNTGLSHATGDYVYFFDSDDLLDAGFTATIARMVATQDEPDVILFSGRSFGEGVDESSRSNAFLRPFDAAGLNGNEAVARLVQAGTPSPSACLYVSKRALWETGQLSFKPIVHEDDELFLRLVLAANRVSVCRDILFYRRVRAMSIMSSGKTRKNAEGLLVAASTHAELYRDGENRPAATRRAIRKRAIRTAQRYLRVCRKVGMAADSQRLLRIAYMTRSARLFVPALFRVAASRR